MAAKGTKAAAEQKKLDEALFYAARTGSDQDVKRLLVEGANVNFILDTTSTTPLMAAIEGTGTLTTVKLLLESGADLTKTDMAGLTCMHWACMHGRKDIIKHLLHAGMKLDSPRDKKGKTPEDYLKETGHSSLIDELRQECRKVLD